MTETIDTAQPEALRLALLLEQVRVGDTWRSVGSIVAKSAKEIRLLHDALAAAEARNAALTDDAARYRFLRRCKGQEHDPLFTVQHEIDGTLWGGDLDVAIDEARAAASISTKGDGHGTS